MPSQNLKFCAIVPTYNRPLLLKKVLGSFQAQTYPVWTCIVVDDASTDDYKEVKEFFSSDERIRFHRREINGGVNQACNTGLDIAAKNDIDFIAIVDDDDYYEPDYLEVAAGVIKTHPQYGWFISNNIGEVKESSKTIQEEGELDYIDDYIYRKFRGDKARLIRADILKNLRFSKKFRSSHRWPFFMEVGERTKIWAFTHGSVHKSYLPGGITKGIKKTTIADILHRPYKHWYAITKRPTKWVAYKYLFIELIKIPVRLIQHLSFNAKIF